MTESTQQNPDCEQIRCFKDAIARCQSLGMRVSRQRRLILELLWQDQEHLSARQIYDRLNRDGQCVGHTSVYQNLEALTNQGIIECVDRSGGRLYSHISDRHSHVHALDTKQVVDVEVELPSELLAQVEAQTGFKITEYRVDFFGYRNLSEDKPDT